MTKKRYKIGGLIVLFLFLLLTIFYAITCNMIFQDVKSICINAQHQYNGTPVQALVELLNDDDQGFESKNKAVWALGQIGDAGALPTLKKLETGIPCEKPCPKHKYICQYELAKAIEGCSGGFSLTRWMYRTLT